VNLRLAFAALILPSVVLSPSAHADFTATLDGKKTTQLVLKQDATRGVATTNPSDSAVVSCTAAACGRLDFFYKPARGVTGNLGLAVHWFYPQATDVDLYLVSRGAVVARCAAMTGNARRVVVPRAQLHPGALYTAVMYYSHSVGEKANMTVTLPAAPAPPGVTVPPNLDDTEVVSCST
jgi:hypothetical protein